MRRYLLFGFNDHYPLGGWADHITDVDTVDEAKQIAELVDKTDSRQDQYQIVDTQMRHIIIMGDHVDRNIIEWETPE